MFVGYRIIVAYRIDDAFVVTRQYVHLPIEYIVPWYVFEVWSLSICQPLCDNPDDIWALFSHISQTYQRRFHATYISPSIFCRSKSITSHISHPIHVFIIWNNHKRFMNKLKSDILFIVLLRFTVDVVCQSDELNAFCAPALITNQSCDRENHIFY